MNNKTFTTFNKFDGLDKFASKMTEYLQLESKFFEESFVLSLNSEFGSGKSTFFEMWGNQLNNSDPKNFNVIFINAWELDFHGDPLLSIVSQLLKLKPLDTAQENEIKVTAGKLGKFGLSIGNDIVQKLIGIDILKAGQYAESAGGVATPEQKDGQFYFQLYEEKNKLFNNLKSQLKSLVAQSEFPILIIVDELDRCRPTYAIDFLETIKHFFDIKGLIFVLGVDKKQLASSARALFGQQLNFDDYYRKFVHRNIRLQVNSKLMINSFCKKLAHEYLSPEAFSARERHSYAEHNYSRMENVMELCAAFSLNARQMHEFFRISAHIVSLPVKSSSKLLWGWHIGIFFMTILSIKNHDLYEKIGNQNITLSEFTEFMKTLPLFNHEANDGLWWAVLLYLGIFSKCLNKELEESFYELGVWNKEAQGDFEKELNEYCKAFSGRFGKKTDLVFSEIYKRLEELRTFEQN
jgi:hypothetical protein